MNAEPVVFGGFLPGPFTKPDPSKSEQEQAAQMTLPVFDIDGIPKSERNALLRRQVLYLSHLHMRKQGEFYPITCPSNVVLGLEPVPASQSLPQPVPQQMPQPVPQQVTQPVLQEVPQSLPQPLAVVASSAAPVVEPVVAPAFTDEHRPEFWGPEEDNLMILGEMLALEDAQENFSGEIGVNPQDISNMDDMFGVEVVHNQSPVEISPATISPTLYRDSSEEASTLATPPTSPLEKSLAADGLDGEYVDITEPGFSENTFANLADWGMTFDL